jgi:putative hydrolase of the HAD superfamily
MDEAERRRLTALIRETPCPPPPLPPPLPAGWEDLLSPPLPPLGRTIRAVLFDVYGTLFCSAAGDIGIAADCSAGVDGALDALARQYRLPLPGEALRSFFRRRVSRLHRTRLAETAWPEIRVEEIWAAFLREQGLDGGEAAGREFALRYELAVNPVCPMPGAAETIRALKNSGVPLGLVSNAQFFTPLLFDAFLDGPPEKTGFDPGLLIWSFEAGEAKPASRLFDAAARRLGELGVAAADCVFVGNDMRSDIYGAAGAGFKGILFAGDGRSLRLREGDALTGGLRPSRIIRRLEELALP